MRDLLKLKYVNKIVNTQIKIKMERHPPPPSLYMYYMYHKQRQ